MVEQTGLDQSENDQGADSTQNPQTSSGAESTQNISLENQSQNRQKIGHTLYKKGELAGQKQAYNEIGRKLSVLGLDVNNLDDNIEQLQSLIKPESENANQNSKISKQSIIDNLQQRLIDSERKTKEIESKGQKLQKENEIKYLIRNEANKYNPHSLEETVDLFYNKFEFDKIENRIEIKDKETGMPSIDNEGKFNDISDLFRNFTQDEKWRFRSSTSGGIGIQEGGNYSDNVDVDKIARGDEGYIDYYLKNKEKIRDHTKKYNIN